jgi:RNA polymerase sigma-70 factor (ECF subfamily)
MPRGENSQMRSVGSWWIVAPPPPPAPHFPVNSPASSSSNPADLPAVLTGQPELETASGRHEGAMDPEDSVLVARCQAGDQSAFEPIVNRYRGKIYAMIVNMIGNDADAWDLAQETFLKAWRALPKFENRASFFTWLYRIAHNVTYDWLRKKKIQAEGEFDDSEGRPAIAPGSQTTPHSEFAPDVQIENRELGRTISEALKQLTPEHRSVILLKEIDGLSYQEIADALGISIGTVMSRLFYARKKLQGLLKDVYHAQSPATHQETKP